MPSRRAYLQLGVYTLGTYLLKDVPIAAAAPLVETPLPESFAASKIDEGGAIFSPYSERSLEGLGHFTMTEYGLWAIKGHYPGPDAGIFVAESREVYRLPASGNAADFVRNTIWPGWAPESPFYAEFFVQLIGYQHKPWEV